MVLASVIGGAMRMQLFLIKLLAKLGAMTRALVKIA
jgi:hypothetical protein